MLVSRRSVPLWLFPRSPLRYFAISLFRHFAIRGQLSAPLLSRVQDSNSLTSYAKTIHMKIVIAGGTGQVGQVLRRAFSSAGHDIVILTRSDGSVADARFVRWDGTDAGQWANELNGADLLINLAGRSVNCRYNPRNRRDIIDSRVNSTRVLGEAASKVKNPPRVWLQSSTATIYAHTYGASNDEFTGIIGGNEPDVPETWRFSIDVATAWEKAFDQVHVPGMRKVKLRSAMVMSPDKGGVFDTLLTLVKRGLGGRAGDGRQYVSWIHERDFVRALRMDS